MKLYYKQLSPQDKKIHDVLLPAIINMDESCFVEGVTLTDSESRYNTVYDIIQFIRQDYPEIFWAPFPKAKNCTSDGKDGVRITLHYPFTKEEKDKYQEHIDAYINMILSRFSSLSDYDYAIAVFEWLTKNVSYINSKNDDLLDEDNSIFGVFYNYQTRCLGYSCAFSLLMKKRNIRCSICSSTLVGVRHVWNIVELDGVWCHVDACWADRDDIFSSESVNMSKYYYFGMTEKEALVDCRMPFFNKLRENGVSEIGREYVPRFNKWPNADSHSNSYYVKNGLYFTDESPEIICEIIKKKLFNSDDKTSDKRISIRFAEKDTLLSFTKSVYTLVGNAVSELNKEHNLNYILNSASYNQEFNICDMFFSAN